MTQECCKVCAPLRAKVHRITLNIEIKSKPVHCSPPQGLRPPFLSLMASAKRWSFSSIICDSIHPSRCLCRRWTPTYTIEQQRFLIILLATITCFGLCNGSTKWAGMPFDITPAAIISRSHSSSNDENNGWDLSNLRRIAPSPHQDSQGNFLLPHLSS